MDLCQVLGDRSVTGQRYDHPILMSEKAIKQDVFGLSGDLFCPHCHGKFDFIFVEFEKPLPDSLAAWRETIETEMDEDIMICPKCGHRNMELI
jgi:Zn finger protein HypA/HybF involved in hydrogenase expression